MKSTTTYPHCLQNDKGCGILYCDCTKCGFSRDEAARRSGLPLQYDPATKLYRVFCDIKPHTVVIKANGGDDNG